MNENEQKQIAIERYTNIQRIKKYGEDELIYQEKIAKAELELLGVSIKDLELTR